MKTCGTCEHWTCDERGLADIGECDAPVPMWVIPILDEDAKVGIVRYQLRRKCPLANDCGMYEPKKG